MYGSDDRRFSSSPLKSPHRPRAFPGLDRLPGGAVRAGGADQRVRPGAAPDLHDAAPAEERGAAAGDEEEDRAGAGEGEGLRGLRREEDGEDDAHQQGREDGRTNMGEKVQIHRNEGLA